MLIASPIVAACIRSGLRLDSIMKGQFPVEDSSCISNEVDGRLMNQIVSSTAA